MREASIVLITIFALSVPALTLATGTGIIKLQGCIMDVDAKKNVITVNERSFTCNQQTAIFNEKGLPIPFEKLKAGEWVYIEGISNGGMRGHIGRKIYIIQRYIHEKEKHLYPFVD